MGEQHDDEKIVAVHAREFDTSSSSQEVLQEYDEAAWETGVAARFPWLGIGSLVCVIIAAGAAALVLALCNGRAQSTWPDKITPNVILAVINAFANIMLAISIGQGVAIAWWRKVIHGATVTDLHHSWGFSTSVVSLLKGWKYLNFIALAALAAKLAIIDSILLQRALQTYLASDPARNVTILAPRTTTWPTTGIIAAGSDEQVASVRADFQNTYVNAWNGGNSIVSNSAFSGCDGVCQGTFEGAGFAYSLSEPIYEQLNLTDARWQNGTNVPLFEVSFEMLWANSTKKYSSIFANMVWFSADTPTGGEPTGDCTGTRNSQTMEIRPALLDIDFTYEDFSKLNPTGGTAATYNIGNRLGLCDICSSTTPNVQFNEAMNQLHPFKLKRYLDYPEDDGRMGGNTTMGGVFLALQSYLGASANITYNITGKSWKMSQQGTLQLQQAARDGWDVTPGSCHYDYSGNTYLVVIMAVNSLGFVYTNGAAFLASSSYNITATQNAVGVHYRTNFAFMGAAVASMVLCALLVLPTYWKFWELGRPVSLAPVEIANAFRAPVLDSSKASNAMVDELLSEVGDRKVMFGQTPQGRLGVEEMGRVKKVGTA